MNNQNTNNGNIFNFASEIEVPKVNIFIQITQDQNHVKEVIFEIISKLIPAYKEKSKQEIEIKELTGGLTNKLYKISDGKLKVLIRIYGNKTEMIIDRVQEIKILNELQKSGFGPKFYGTFNNGYIYEYYEGRSFEPLDLTSLTWNKQIGEELGRWHSQNINTLQKVHIYFNY